MPLRGKCPVCCITNNLSGSVALQHAWTALEDEACLRTAGSRIAEAWRAPGALQLHSAFGSYPRSWSMSSTLISSVENSFGCMYGPSHHTAVAAPCMQGKAWGEVLSKAGTLNSAQQQILPAILKDSLALATASLQ